MNDLPLAALVTERRRHAKVERLDRVAVADMGAPVFDLENGASSSCSARFHRSPTTWPSLIWLDA
jgi:hypothetical protein